jgi:tetratricopeptide (TPR) repeat protein
VKTAFSSSSSSSSISRNNSRTRTRTTTRTIKRTTRIVITFLFLLALTCQQTFAATEVESAFDNANKLYAENKFAEAANAYEKLTATGTISPALYFNLGNAQFKAGQIGRAIAAYRQAEILAPRDPDLSANLQFARNQVQGPKIKSSAWQRWLGTLSVNEWTWLCVTGVWITFGLLIARQLKPALVPALGNWTWLTAGSTAILCACLASAFSQSAGERIAIVTVTDATVRNSPLDQSPSNFTAHDGAELRVLDSKDDWLQVTDDTRRIGWLKRDVAVLVKQ